MVHISRKLAIYMDNPSKFLVFIMRTLPSTIRSVMQLICDRPTLNICSDSPGTHDSSRISDPCTLTSILGQQWASHHILPQQYVCFPARKFQISALNSTTGSTFTCIAWMLNRGYVAVGGNDGSLRVMLLNLEQDRMQSSSSATGTLNPWLSSQQLEGHTASAQVKLLCWNEVYQKLASSDDAGLIIVWMNHGSDESWFEEMINNRQKSSVAALKWSNDGTKIAIAYEDGQVIVGSVDGNRLWNKDIGSALTKIAWSADDSLLLLGLMDGECHSYDQNGNFITKIPMLLVESVDMEAALTKDLKKDVIVSMEWYTPTRPCKVQLNGGIGNGMARINKQDTVLEEPVVFRGKVPEDRPCFLIAYQNGNIQLMCNENSSKNVSIIRLPSTIIISAQWSPDGSTFAVAGQQTDLPESQKNVLHFISAYGMRLQIIRLAAGNFAGIAWESTGLRIGALIDTNIFLVVIKYPYKWAYCSQTLVYSYTCPDTLQEVLVFYETKMEVKTKRYLHNVSCIKAFGDYCVVIFRTEELRGAYTMQLCDSIGTPVDTQSTHVQPDFVAMNNSVVVVANLDCFTVWHFTLPRKAAMEGYRQPPKELNNLIYYLDQNQVYSGPEDPSESRRPNKNLDNICSICAGPNFFLIGRDSGAVHRFSLPEVEQQAVFKAGLPPAILMSINFLRSIQAKLYSLVPGFEKKEVWSVEWDTEKDDTLAIMEKQRLMVIRGTETEEPVLHSGRICSFKDLVVRTVLLDEVFKDHEHVNKSFFVNIEIKILKTIKELLDAGKINDAIVLIEKNKHPKLWSILATAALKRLDFKTAEHAFVKLQDYGGIQFLKKLQNIQSEAMKKAEVSVFLGDLDLAEKIYFDNDRRDLTIDMLKKMHDWFRIQQVLQTSTGPGDDILIQQVWKHVGDYYMERQKWQSAAKYYEHSQNHAELARCYLMMDDFARMETLSQQLPDGSEVLKQLAEIFTNYGLCEQAVDCYLRSNKISEAFETCIKLNHRCAESAQQLCLPIVGSKSKNLAVAQLYRKAANYLQAARIVFEVADDEHAKQAPPPRLKKLYVMGGLLVEEFHEQSQQKLVKSKGEKHANASTALEGLLNEDQILSMDDSKLIDTAWRGAEAYHFFMLAHKQLYNDNFDAAMKTSLTLAEYDDILDPMDVYSLLGLSSFLAECYELAMQIFLKHPPKDDHPTKVECTNCDKPITDYTVVCPNLSCDTRFPVCIASGRPLYDFQFWLCPSCKHRAYEQEMQEQQFCPLCHFMVDK
uniref:Anaphase-promoting complex subunit 4-like WD40 domain-containing protein n=1 Tax=Ditylenchus dipsaci TaxID=166011 RepID=A0A915D9I2_9BILA